jgi:hypothetical protein
VVHALKT